MKFKAEPNLVVRLSNAYVKRITGLKHIKFDENGIYETEHEYFQRILKQHFEVVENKSNNITLEEEENPTETIVEPENDLSELSYNELRALAKEKGIEFDKNPKKEELIERLGE